MWGPNCPRCGKGPTEWLATTNEWRWYCKPCDIRFNDRLETPLFELYEMTSIRLADFKENGIDATVVHERKNSKTGKMEVVSTGTVRSALDKLEKLLPEKPAPDSVLGKMIDNVRSLDDKN
jgi:hypothetical protein